MYLQSIVMIFCYSLVEEKIEDKPVIGILSMKSFVKEEYIEHNIISEADLE